VWAAETRTGWGGGKSAGMFQKESKTKSQEALKRHQEIQQGLAPYALPGIGKKIGHRESNGEG
jgi:hypothetical protein